MYTISHNNVAGGAFLLCVMLSMVCGISFSRAAVVQKFADEGRRGEEGRREEETGKKECLKFYPGVPQKDACLLPAILKEVGGSHNSCVLQHFHNASLKKQ